MTDHLNRALRDMTALLLACIGLFSATAACASQAADAAALQDFQLTDDFLAHYESFEEDVAQDPCNLSPLLSMQKAQSSQMGLDEMAAAYDAQPGVHAVLARNDLTAKTAMLGMMTLLGAAMQDIAAQHPDMVKNGEMSSTLKVSDANMAFYQAHQAEIHEHQMKLGQEQLKRNHGKLPACFSAMGGQ